MYILLFIMHALIKFVVLHLFVEVKALLGVCYIAVCIRHKINLLCLCRCLSIQVWVLGWVSLLLCNMCVVFVTKHNRA